MRTLIRSLVAAATIPLLAGSLVLLTDRDLRGQDTRRLLLPEGTVLTVRTDTSLNSETARQGQRFTTTVTDTVRVEGFTAIPAGATIEGVIALAREADDRRSGVLGLDFTGIRFPDGRTVSIDGKLTSTDPEERRRIEAQGEDARVVLVGGRRGAGAAIGALGEGEANDPVSSILGAIGGLLSEGDDVRVPEDAQLAVQLERGVVLTARDTRRDDRAPSAFTIFTSEEAISAAQRELGANGYYQGPVDGRLDERTRRALLTFQIDHGILATGNLDGRTAAELGLSLGAGFALSAGEASLVQSDAEHLLHDWRETLGIAPSGRLDPYRPYRTEELELLFALSALADNAALYEQLVERSGRSDGLIAASRALAATAGRVDRTISGVEVPAHVQAGWSRLELELEPIAPDLVREDR